MSVTLKKGGKFTLKKGVTNLKNIRVGLGWSVNNYGDTDYDLDASVFLLAGNDKVTCDEDLVFYGNLVSKKGAVEHMGDNRTGGTGDEDDEVINIRLSKVAGNIEHIVFVATIYEKDDAFNFGLVDNAYIRVVNNDDDTEILRYNLTDEYNVYDGVIVGSIDRTDNDEWEFNAIGTGIQGGLATLCNKYGIEVED